MPTAAALRLQIERTLEHRFPAALTPATQADMRGGVFVEKPTLEVVYDAV